MNDAQPAQPVYDRTTEDVGNIVEFGHVNIRVPDQRLANLFYVMGLGLTRDPYLIVGVDNMWINVGTCQFHLPTGPAQVLQGLVGLVFPDLDALLVRLAEVKPRLVGTEFTYAETQGAVAVTSPWGNRLLCHAPDARRFGRITLGMPYVEVDATPGSAAGIARFYREILDSPAEAGEDSRGPFATVAAGQTQLVFRETDREQPPYDGHHVQISLADFSGPHARLLQRGLITEESNQSQYRFERIVDPDSGADLARIEHEVRSMRHPMYARALVNRNPEQTNNRYAPGHETWSWAMSAE